MMEKIYEINIMENKKIVWGLNITSFILLIPFFPLFTYLADLVTENLRNPAERGFDFLFYLFPLFITNKILFDSTLLNIIRKLVTGNGKLIT